MPLPAVKLAYLFSRYPVPSQTFCDTEMRAMEVLPGWEVEVFSCSPPPTSFQHGPEDRPHAPVFYAPPPRALAAWEARAKHDGTWPAALVAEHEVRFGTAYQPARRAAHAVYFADLVRRRGVQHVHVHFTGHAAHTALFLHALTGVPFSITAHAQDFLVDLGSDELLQEMCSRAAFVVTVSDWSRRALLEKVPTAAATVYRVHNGLPPERWPVQQGQSPPGEGRPFQIFSVGRLIDFKGFDNLIASCALLRDRGVNFRCEIAGDGPNAGALARQVADLGLQGRVVLIGLLPQVTIRKRMYGCDVFALACRVDAQGACDVLPTVILEGMMAGRPVVSTRLAAVPEQVEDGVTGLLVPPDDPAAFADALARLADDPGAAASLGQAGRARAEAMFSAESSARQLAVLFEELRPGPALALPAPSPGTPAQPCCLFERWPPPSDTLPALTGCVAGLRLVAICADDPATLLASPDLAAMLSRVEWLPDAMVIEAAWREATTLAHRLEAWRKEAGGGWETDDFLRAARRAAYLSQSWSSSTLLPPPRLLAVGADAILCAWLLRRLDVVAEVWLLLPTAAAGVGEFPGSTLRRLAPKFAGGWVPGRRKLAESLGPGFRSTPPDAAAWDRFTGGVL